MKRESYTHCNIAQKYLHFLTNAHKPTHPAHTTVQFIIHAHLTIRKPRRDLDESRNCTVSSSEEKLGLWKMRKPSNNEFSRHVTISIALSIEYLEKNFRKENNYAEYRSTSAFTFMLIQIRSIAESLRFEVFGMKSEYGSICEDTTHDKTTDLINFTNSPTK